MPDSIPVGITCPGNVVESSGNPLQTGVFDYHPFGMQMRERSYDHTGMGYRYGFNSQEKDDEIYGTGNSYTAEFWQYDPRIGRRWNLDPKPIESISPYACFVLNPIIFTDHFGDTVKVTTSKGVYLFTLDDGRTQVRTVTARQLYDAGYQWFEPKADKYVPLLDINPNIIENRALKHFKWTEIALFSNQDFRAVDFFQKGKGDWKQSSEGADGFFLVTVDGMPYWSDAVGQIPFAIWNTKRELKKSSDALSAINATLNAERDFGSGTLFGKRDNDNSYDHYFALRGAKAATEAFSINSEGGLKFNSDFSPSNSSLSKPISAEDAVLVKESVK